MIKIRSKAKQIAIISLIACFAAGCGGEKAAETVSSAAEAELSSESLSETADTEAAAEAEAADAGAAAQDADPAMEGSEAEITETYPETVASEGSESTEYFGIMHATVTGAVKEGDVTVYSFSDKNDPENVWSVPGTELGDILIDPVSGAETAILFCGDMMRDSENVDFVVMLPEGEYEILKAEGVTTENAMSTFAISTSSGEEIFFLKDNCRIEDGSLEQDSGDHIVVYYARSKEDGTCYPFRVYAAE